MTLEFIGLISFIYITCLFVIAYLCEKNKVRLKGFFGTSFIYALSLGVYTTAWTFYGSIGQAANNGLGFLGVYLGPTLLAPVWLFLWKKMIRICRMQRITSIADFISARYGKNTSLGILVSLFCLAIVIPYISIQLKALDFSVNLLRDDLLASPDNNVPFYLDITLVFSIVFAVFAMYFGTRRMDPTEKHPGVVYVVALESIIKLICFIIGGIVIIYFIFDGVQDIFSKVGQQIDLNSFAVLDQGGLDYKSWLWIMVLSSVAFFLLPRQFHMAIIENESAEDIKTAAWLTPLYLLLISILVIPIAFAGTILFDGQIEPDTYLISIPLLKNYFGVAMLVFIGGLAAISGMIIVSVMSLSIMISNNIFLPLLLNLNTQFKYFLNDLDTRLLEIRRIIILVILLLSYGFYKMFSINYSLVSVGLISFAGVTQLAPMVILGMFWKYSNKTGAMVGFIAGTIIWAFTLPIANLSQLGILDVSIFNDGLFGLAWLKPTSLFGIQDYSPIAHGAFWSLTINILLHLFISLTTKRSALEISQSDIFINPEKYYKSDVPKSSIFLRKADYEEFSNVLSAILGQKKYDDLITQFKKEQSISVMPDSAGPELINFMEKYLTGSIGTASANIVLNHLVEHQPVDTKELIRLMDETYQVYEHSQEIKTKSAELKNLTKQLTSANDQLQELDVLKNEFIANITHELRTPITAIRSLANILNSYEVSEKEKNEFLEIIDKESERISHLVNQVLDIRKLEDKPQIFYSNFDLMLLVKETVNGFAELKEDREISINGPVNIELESDQFKVKQILVNLISNAIKFTDPVKGQIAIDISLEDGEVIVSVEDNGIGINKENLHDIFDKFYQVPLEKSIKTKGTGLGLYLCRQFVALLGGTISVDSRFGYGSKFMFSLPMKK